MENINISYGVKGLVSTDGKFKKSQPVDQCPDSGGRSPRDLNAV